MDKLTLKRQYNKCILRLQKADMYFNNDNISIEDRSSEKVINLYNELIAEIGKLQDKYKELYNEEMTKEVKINGFK